MAKNNVFDLFDPADIYGQAIYSPSEMQWNDSAVDYENPWLFEDKPLTDSNTVGFVGMVYLIVNTVTGRKYVGKKIFKFTNRIKVKGKSRRKVIVKPSDWKDYYGSSDLLNVDIQYHGKMKFQRIVLCLCKSKKAMTYVETREQFVRHVLESKEYYNTNILGKFFVKDKEKDLPFSDNILFFGGDLSATSAKWKQKRYEAMLGDNNPAKRPEVREKISQSLQGREGPNKGRKFEDTSCFRKSNKTKQNMSVSAKTYWKYGSGVYRRRSMLGEGNPAKLMEIRMKISQSRRKHLSSEQIEAIKKDKRSARLISQDYGIKPNHVYDIRKDRLLYAEKIKEAQTSVLSCEGTGSKTVPE